MTVNKKESTQHELVLCDLEWPRLQKELENLQPIELDQIEASVNKIQIMTWDQIYKTASKSQKRGLNFEPISGQKTNSGKTIASIRISDKFRARVCRDGRYMRFISLHPDHDSAYGESGGENI
jgi:hypothetical protein